MDDEIKEILRDIRDAQREQVEILRESHRQASEVNEKALDNHSSWNSQNKLTNKLMIVVVVVVIVAFIVMEVLKAVRPDTLGP